jgi:enoyl-CoA hydratase
VENISAMKTFTNLLVENIDNILHITINRPASLNALNRLTIQEIGAAIEELSNNSELKGAILTGAGDKAFVAGADISEFTSLSLEDAKALSKAGHDIFNSIENCSKPVIACVNGFALGGGCELAMACHMRIASPNARFGQPEVNLGIIPGYGGTQRLIQLIGKGRAFELLTTADMIDADRAEELGLVNYVEMQGDLLAKASGIINKIAKKAPLAVAKTIVCVNAYFDKKQNGFNTEIDEFAACAATEDFKEGASAFLEKRKAKFIGK